MSSVYWSQGKASLAKTLAVDGWWGQGDLGKVWRAACLSFSLPRWTPPVWVLESFSVSLSPSLGALTSQEVLGVLEVALFDRPSVMAQRSGGWCAALSPCCRLSSSSAPLPWNPAWSRQWSGHPSLRPSVSASVGAGSGFLGCPSPVPSLFRPARLTPPRKAPLLGAGADPPCWFSHFRPLSYLAQLLKGWNWEGMGHGRRGSEPPGDWSSFKCWHQNVRGQVATGMKSY